MPNELSGVIHDVIALARMLCARVISEKEYELKYLLASISRNLIILASEFNAELRRRGRVSISDNGIRPLQLYREVPLLQLCDRISASTSSILTLADARTELSGNELFLRSLRDELSRCANTLLDGRFHSHEAFHLKPQIMGLPDCYVRCEPVHIRAQPQFSIIKDQFVEYLWHHCAREAAAGALCALNVLENDQFGVSFYLDFINQSFDEHKHALMYWTWLSEYFRTKNYRREFSDGRILRQVEKYVETGSGLELPAEGAFYEAFYHASLIERLFIMQIDTEGGGIKRFNSKLKTPIVQKDARLHELFKEDLADEKYHVRIGTKWTRTLIPDPTYRKKLFKDAMDIRNYLMVISTIESRVGLLG